MKVAKVCRLSGYPVADWSTFASTLFDGVPSDLFDAAELTATKKGCSQLAAFLEWEAFTKWCTINLNVINHVDQARTAIASLKQTSTVAIYKAAFDVLVAQVGDDVGQQLFWWFQGLKPFIATATAVDPAAHARYTAFSEAQSAAVAVESTRMPAGPVATSGLSTLDASASALAGC